MENKLKLRWSKREKDMLITYPVGISTKTDANYLFANAFTDEFQKELIKRGYDITTIKFEITVDPKSERFETRFPSLAKEYKKLKENKDDQAV